MPINHRIQIVVVIEFGHNDGGGATATTTGVAGLEDDTVTQSVVLANGDKASGPPLRTKQAMQERRRQRIAW